MGGPDKPLTLHPLPYPANIFPLPTVRRLFAITLLAVLLGPLAAPLFALSTSDTNLPACCRKEGKHHCMMSAEDRAAIAAFNNALPQFSQTPAPCPFAPRLLPTAHTTHFALTASTTAVAAITAHPNRTAQTESRLRIAATRSRHKRGPPSRSA